jgi:putative oxidoreductase
MQRLFSSFPEGPPGVGLLLLRGGVGMIVIVKAMMVLALEMQGSVIAAVIIKACTGLLLIVGLLTPYAGTVLCLNALFAFVLSAPAGWLEWDASLLIAVTSVALALVGPGAYSIDARLFGRREIVVGHVPPNERSKRP